MDKLVAQYIQDSIDAKQGMLAASQIAVLQSIADTMVAAYRDGKKVIVCGNGGSAADAQHWTAELVARFEKNRPALPAIAITTNSSSVTAIGNDFAFEEIFSRQVEAFCQAGDVVVGITTSGNSPNVLRAMAVAKERKAVTVGFTRAEGGKLKDACDICFCAPSSATPRVQECHILAIHIICKLIEETLFGDK